MRLISAFHDQAPVAAILDGDVARILEGVTEIGRDTPIAKLESLRTRAVVPISDLTPRPVVPNPRRIICVGLNYRSHIEETKRSDQEYPVLFTKFHSSLIGAEAEIVLPAESAQIDYEGELAVVIGATVRRVSREDAHTAVLGYTIANDITMRDFQYKSHQWLQGKAWDASTPLGPLIVTPDELGPLHDVPLTTHVDGQLVQSATLGSMIFPVDELISTISTFTTLEPGDLILTGTPGGVGYRRTPQLFLRPGSTITVQIDGIGALTNVARAETDL